MRLADTNVVIDLLREVREPDREALDRLAIEAESMGEPLVVRESVLAESVWVLTSAFGMPAETAAAAIRSVLQGEGLVPWDRSVASAALDLMSANPRLDIVDCLLAARADLDGDDVVTSDTLLQRAIAESARAPGADGG